MAFRIERNDITKVHTQAIVNTANPLPVIGSGTDTAVYNAAGKKELLEARKEIGLIEPGHSAASKSFKLQKNGIKYIIHTVGTHYNPQNPETVQILRNCYSSALATARDLACKSVALPLLATGNYGFPKELGLKIAIEEISNFLLNNEIDIILVVYDKKSYMISEKLFDDIQNFLDENYEGDNFDLDDKPVELFGAPQYLDVCEEDIHEYRSPRFARRQSRSQAVCGAIPEALSCEAAPPLDVDTFINQNEKSLNFQNTLQRHIAQKKQENATIYKKACIDKKFFSKIISNKDYVPKKQTVMALGLALELPLEDYEAFLASAGYAFMPASKFDLIVKYCVMNSIYNLVEVDIILDSHGLNCFAPA